MRVVDSLSVVLMELHIQVVTGRDYPFEALVQSPAAKAEN